MFINRGLFQFTLKNKFSKVFRNNLFFGSESLSGAGSDLLQTQIISKRLPEVCKQLGIKSLLDVPCGDFNWMSRVNLTGIRYTGADIVPQIIQQLNESFKDDSRNFKEINVVKDVPGNYDAIFCRDLFVHLNNTDIFRTINNFCDSKSTYLIATTFTNVIKNKNLPLLTKSVGWRPINLNLKPFDFPKPIILINEGCTEYNGKFSDKSIGVWDLSELKKN